MAFYRIKERGEWEEGGYTDLKQAKAGARKTASITGEVVPVWSEAVNRIIYRAKPKKGATKRANPASVPRGKWMNGKVLVTPSGTVKFAPSGKVVVKAKANPVKRSTRIVREGNYWLLKKITRGSSYDGSDSVAYRTKAEAQAAAKKWKSAK